MRYSQLAVVSFFSALFGAGVFVAGAAAAPQVLMVVAPTESLPLVCEGGVCATEVAAICLQPDRANPTRGKRYTLGGPDAAPAVTGARSSVVADTITLIGRTAGGRESVLPAGNLAVQAERDHLAVKLSVSEDLLRRLGLASLSVRVTGNVLLFPEAESRDPEPQTDADVALAKSALRRTAERIFEKRRDTLDGAGVVRTAINALPRDRPTTMPERRRAQRQALRARVSGKALRHARDAFTACRSVGDRAVNREYNARYSYRACLGIMQDDLVDNVNREYWDALKAGS